MTNHDIDALADDALNAAIASIQAAVALVPGLVAALFTIGQ